MPQYRFGVSRGRACRLVGQHRRAQWTRPRRPPYAELRPRGRPRELSAAYRWWGCREAEGTLPTVTSRACIDASHQAYGHRNDGGADAVTER
jgi:hypothetical protein